MKVQNPHSKSIDQILEILSTTPGGLRSKQAEKRLEKYGENVLPDKSEYSLLHGIFEQINSLLIYVLIAAAAISYLFGHQIDLYVILGVILVNVAIGLYHDYKAHKVVRALQKNIEQSCNVYRDGQKIKLDVKELVPGDVVEVTDGDRIPADIRLLKAYHVKAKESSLTGESTSVAKKTGKLDQNIPLGDRSNMLYMDTHLVTGSSLGVVVNTSINTVIGEINKELENIEVEETLFHKRMHKLTNQMVFITGITFVLTLAVGILRGLEYKSLLMFAIASLVSGIPEGLPAVVSIVLSIAASRMSSRGVVLRNLPTIETLSTVDTIITDKTGTLTQNIMVVKKLILNSQKEIEITGSGWDTAGNFRVDGAEIEIKGQLKELLEFLSISSKGEVINGDKNARATVLGDPTEASRHVLARKAGIEKDQLLCKYEIIDELPYNQELKLRASLVSRKNDGKKILIVVGGAENVLNRSNPENLQYFTQKISDETSLGMRLQGCAVREVPVKTTKINEDVLERLDFKAILSIKDPVRKNVSGAIEKAKTAGIRVIMATGDHKNTALAVAREVGILSQTKGDYPLALSDDELQQLPDKKFSDMMENVNVFARLTPLTKLRIASLLQERGKVIAMTGDGVNDAPALKKANIGISMGKIGTDAARQASDIVLFNDDFATIIDAVREGRTVFENLKLTSLYLITTNIAEDIILILSMIAGFPLPLLPLQILWLNLVTDGVSDVALATEKPQKDTLRQPPRDASEGIIDKSNIKFSVFMSLVMFVLSMGVFMFFERNGSLTKARTATFLVMAFTQMFNMFNMRSLDFSVFKLGFFQNKYVIGSFFLSTVLLVLVTEITFLRDAFSLQSINLEQFIVLFLISSLVLWLGEMYKLVGRE